MAERRRESRIDVSWPLRVAGITSVGEGRMVNASLGGLLFESDADFDAKAIVTLRIVLCQDTNIDCAAQIVRVESRADSKLYAVEIRYLSAADRQRLSFALMLAREPAMNGCIRHSKP